MLLPIAPAPSMLSSCSCFAPLWLVLMLFYRQANRISSLAANQFALPTLRRGRIRHVGGRSMKPDLCSAAVAQSHCCSRPGQSRSHARTIRRVRSASSLRRRRRPGRTSWPALSDRSSPGVQGQQVVVENRAGANGIIGMEAAAKAEARRLHAGPRGADADDESLRLQAIAVRHLPRLHADHPDRYQPFGWWSIPRCRRSVKEVVALGRARPGALNWLVRCRQSDAPGGRALRHRNHPIKMTHVPYKEQTPAVTDLISGQVTLLFTPMPGASIHVESEATPAGHLRREARRDIHQCPPCSRRAIRASSSRAGRDCWRRRCAARLSLACTARSPAT